MSVGKLTDCTYYTFKTELVGWLVVECGNIVVVELVASVR